MGFERVEILEGRALAFSFSLTETARVARVGRRVYDDEGK